MQGCRCGGVRNGAEGGLERAKKIIVLTWEAGDGIVTGWRGGWEVLGKSVRCDAGVAGGNRGFCQPKRGMFLNRDQIRRVWLLPFPGARGVRRVVRTAAEGVVAFSLPLTSCATRHLLSAASRNLRCTTRLAFSYVILTFSALPPYLQALRHQFLETSAGRLVHLTCSVWRALREANFSVTSRATTTEDRQ